MEIWKIIPNTNFKYQISNYGNVKSLKSKKWREIKPYKNDNGTLNIDLRTEGDRNSTSVHRLVAELFVYNPKNGNVIKHKDANKANNHFENLEWSTHSESVKNAYDTGLKPKLKGEKHGRSKLTQLQVDQIRIERQTLKTKVTDLMAKFNVSKATIQRIIYNKSWF